jgi:hypothetical protein
MRADARRVVSRQGSIQNHQLTRHAGAAIPIAAAGGLRLAFIHCRRSREFSASPPDVSRPARIDATRRPPAAGSAGLRADCERADDSAKPEVDRNESARRLTSP